MSNAALRLTESISSPVTAKAKVPITHPRVRKSRWDGLGSSLFFITVIIVLWLGWQDRNSLRLTAESGTGYALGIIGGVLMLLLLLYPARKRLAFMRHLGPVKWWFRGHMILGIVGPVSILYHCNFKLGSLNSNVSLLCMFLVAGSGLIGRYFYSKLHHGLYGRRATVQDLRQDIELLKDQSAYALPSSSFLGSQLLALEAEALLTQDKIVSNALRIIAYNLRSYWINVNLGILLKRALRSGASQGGAPLTRKQLREERKRLASYLASLRKLNQLSFYERLFSLWHVLHFPLFLMLVISGIVHVIAVHIY
jgi:hypothetical protein